MPTAPPSFRAFLASRRATLNLLREYLASLRAEWWRSEFKASELEVGFGLRKSVVAMANGTGGEVFLGVGDDLSILGTTASQQRVEQELSQPTAEAADWYHVNLNRLVATITPVDLAPKVPGRLAFVVEVVPSAIPVFAHDASGRLDLILRNGSSSGKAETLDAMRWSRESSRERLLRGLFVEFRTMVRQVRIAHGFEIRTGSGISPRLPLLVSSMEDGSFYRLLGEEDIGQILGRTTTSRKGDLQGFLARFLDLEDRLERTRRQVATWGSNQSAHQFEQQVVQQLSNDHAMLEQDVDAFRQWLVTQKIL